MSRRIRVPEKYFEGIAKIISLPEDTFQKLIEAITKLKVNPYPQNFLARLIASVPNISSENVKIMAEAIISLSFNQAGSDLASSDYVDEVIQAIEESRSDKLKLSKDSKEVLKQRFLKITEVKPLALSTKAASVLLEYDRSFVKTRILTDIRPIFDTKAHQSPCAAVIVHMLNIEYHQSGEHKEFYVAMDDEDIQLLMNVLERAKTKAKTLRQTLTSAGISSVDTDSNS